MSQNIQNMQVVKRDGRKEDVAFEKVQERISKSAIGLSVNATKVAQGVLARIVDGITTTELDNITANLAYSWSTTHPDYAELAARIALSNHQRNTPNTFLEVIQILEQVKDRAGNNACLLDPTFIDVVKAHADTIEQHIDYERDFLLDYFGFKTLEKAYLLRDTDRKVVERPQHMWMRVALGIWVHDLPKAFETYDLISKKFYTHATPTLFNAGTKRPQLSSCFLTSMKADSIKGIYDTLQDCAAISQYGGGIGIHCSNIRAKGTLIKGTGGTSNGIVPMLRVFNNTARYVDQCFHPDTLIYTRRGKVSISEVCEGDEVFTSGCDEVVEEDGKHAVMSPATSPTWHKVTKRVEHTYSGPMCIVKMSTRDQVVHVTPQHPVLAVRRTSSMVSDQERLRMGLASLDYIEIGSLTVGDAIAFPTHDNPYAVATIQEVAYSHYTGKLYDLEVEGTHDYLVCGLGIAHNGGGKRNGSFAIYLEPWHADVEEFLELKKNTGSEEERARDLFYALWVPDLFMERVDKNLEWTLFCPNDAPGLADVVGDEFKALYERYEAEGRGKKTISAQKLWFHILDSQIETGTPYLLYKDAANLKSNQQNLGVIKSSNLCVAPETLILTDKGEFPIQSLAGNVVNVWNGDKWSETTVMQTGSSQQLMKVTVRVDKVEGEDYVGSTGLFTLYCTPYHKFILSSESHTPMNDFNHRIEAKDLNPNDQLATWNHPCGACRLKGIVISVENDGRISDTYCFNEPINHAGMFNGVLTGNCTEIIEYSSPDEIAVCNLASLSLPAFVKDKTFDFKQLRHVTGVAIRNLNRVIDVNYYPVPEAERSNKLHRPVGLGVQGLADVFAMLDMPWESEEAVELNKRIFAHMYYAAVEASVTLAASEGVYETYVGSPAYKGKLQFDLWNVAPYKDDDLDWDTLANDIRRIGMRNSLLVAPMPTASTSQILGNCECIEPYATHIFTRRTLAGEFIVLNKHLVKALCKRGLWTPEVKNAIVGNNGSVTGLSMIPEDIQRVYKTVWEIKQKTLIDMAADRGPYICQSQSLNLFLADPDYRKLTSMHFYTWRKGLKTGIYYLRTKAVASAQKFTVEPVKVVEEEGCVMCSS